MKELGLLLILCMFGFSALALDLTITIPTVKVIEYVSDYVYIHDNTETVPDPAWVDPDDGSEAPQIAKYTDNQWVKEHLRRYIVGQIKRGKNAKARDGIVKSVVDDVE